MVAVIPIITAVGEFAAPHLIREATKIGGKKFIQKFGLDAWISITTAVTGGTIAAKTLPVDLQKEKLFGTSISSLPGMPQGPVYSDIEEPKKPEPLKVIPGIHVPKTEEQEELEKELKEPPKTYPPKPEDYRLPGFGEGSDTIPKILEPPKTYPPKLEDIQLPGFPDQSEEFNKPQIYYNEKVGKKMLTKESTDYRLQHKPRGPDDEYPVRLDNLTQTTTGESAGYPKDFYSWEGKRMYAPGPSFEGDEFGIANTESYNIINSVKGNPDAEVTIYRAVPNEKNITKINPSDFVTLSKRYADLHAAGGYGRDGTDSGKVLELKVKVKDIYWDQNDVNEFGYFPEKTKDISKQTKELVPEKPKFGKLTKTETQTAKALKEGKPDFYSRAVESIKNAKQEKFTKGKWKSIVQSNSTKDEMDYLGLTEFLQGNESITKKELLKFVEKKDIAPNITVRSIPKDQMDPLYEGYSLGGYTHNTQEHMVFQIPKGKWELFDNLFKSEHFDTEYGTGNFAWARVQVGYNPQEALIQKTGVLDIAKQGGKIDTRFPQLDNTLIIDEIQSDWIQKLQKEGSAKDWVILKGSDITKEFVKKNYESVHELTEGTDTADAFLMNWSEVQAKMVPYRRIEPDKYYTFSKDKMRPYSSGSIEEAEKKKETWAEAVTDFPLKDSKKFVELVLNEMIRKAVKDGRDSIAITNGQIQYNRYEAMDEERKQGLKKFYDTFVYDQLNKIAKNYGVKLERIDISKGSEPTEGEDLRSITGKIKIAQDNKYTLQKITLQELSDAIKQEDIPGHVSLYNNVGRGQGVEYIEHYLNAAITAQRDVDQIRERTGDTTSSSILNNEVYVWVRGKKDRAFFMGETGSAGISWDMPIVPVKDASENKLVKDIMNLSDADRQQVIWDYSAANAGQDLIQYTEYLRNYKPPEGVDLGYEQDAEQLIKMKLPKKLQKERLSKPIKLSKAKQQTERLFA